MKNLPVRIYDLLSTAQLQKRLEASGLLDRAEWSTFDPEELQHRMAIPLAREIAGFISEVVAGKNGTALELALYMLSRKLDLFIADINKNEAEKPVTDK